MKNAVFAFLLFTIATPLVAIDVKVTQVNDRRTNGSFSQLVISMDLPKITSTDVAARRAIVASATDDTGRTLLDTESQEPQLEAVFRADASRPADVSVTLKNPDRKAKTIREVRGEVELYMPGKDPNSVADLTKYLASPGKPLSNKALKANGVEITVISPAQLDAERKRLGEAKRKEAAEYGYSAEELENVVKEFKESLFKTDEGEILVRIKDPNKRIQDISYVDPKGEVKRISTRDEEGVTYLSTWGEKPQPDWKLRVSMKTPKNLVRYPFELKDVPLP